MKKVVAFMPMGGWTSCLPPVRREPVVKPKSADPFDYLSDADTRKVCEIVILMENHPWTYSYEYEYFEDEDAYEQGLRSEEAMYAALAELPFELAEAVWAKHAPSSRGPYRRFR